MVEIMAENKPRLSTHYKNKVVPELVKSFGYKNIMEVPKLTKISLNMGLGDAVQDNSLIDKGANDLATITGQKPSISKAKRSVSNFKLRQGMKIGAHVTLRGDRMYEFIDRFIALAVPRIRDFRGLPDKSFDGRGNYTIGIKEQLIFPEVDMEKIDGIRGLDVTFVTTAKTDKEAYELLKLMGMPFRKKTN
jgi:large subunit ribosomal protein L5